MSGQIRGRHAPLHRCPPGSPGRACGGWRNLHLSDAPRNPPARPRLLPDLRHGARPRDAHRRRGPECRICRHAEAAVHRGSPRPARRHPGNGRPFRRHGLAACARLGPAATGLCGTRRVLDRLAILRARLAIFAHAQPQYVHADRHGNRCRFPLQPRGDLRARPVSRGVSSPRRLRANLFRGGDRDHRSGHRRTGARIARARADRRRDPRLARPHTDDRATAARRWRRGGHRPRSRACRR